MFARLIRTACVLGSLAATLSLLPAGASAAARPAHPCQYELGFATLASELAGVAGSCLENQGYAPNGDAHQHSTGGLLVWRKADNWTAFTNGNETWINGPQGLARRSNSERFDWEAGVQAGLRVISSRASTPTAPAAQLGPLSHITQTMNNCGPASISEVLRYWGIQKSQGELSAILRHGNRHGMASDGVPAYAASIGMKAHIAYNGSEGQVKALISNGFPVIVEQFVSMGDHFTHYRAIDGYNDGGQYFNSTDTFLGANHHISYKEFDQIWVPVHRKFMVLYPPDKQALVEAVLGTSH